jgi:hypothetical protein
MRSVKSIGFVILATVGLLTAMTAPKVRADEWNKMTKLTFNEPVQVPGVALSAGTYVFKLADSEGDRTIVQIFNEDETQLIATVLAIPDYRVQTPDKTIVSFDERPRGQPEALRAWFYPGDNYGVEFVYPRKRATELALVNKQPVLSMREEAKDVTSLKIAIVEPVAPLPETPPPTVELSDSQQASAKSAPAESAQVGELPRTASYVPLTALGGVLLLAAAFVVRRLSLGNRSC